MADQEPVILHKEAAARYEQRCRERGIEDDTPNTPHWRHWLGLDKIRHSREGEQATPASGAEMAAHGDIFVAVPTQRNEGMIDGAFLGAMLGTALAIVVMVMTQSYLLPLLLGVMAGGIGGGALGGAHEYEQMQHRYNTAQEVQKEYEAVLRDRGIDPQRERQTPAKGAAPSQASQLEESQKIVEQKADWTATHGNAEEPGESRQR